MKRTLLVRIPAFIGWVLLAMLAAHLAGVADLYVQFGPAQPQGEVQLVCEGRPCSLDEWLTMPERKEPRT